MMFTKDQGQELINSTNSVWTTINSVNGRKFTSKTDSSKYIFLPAAGKWDYNSTYGTSYHDDVNEIGFYWSTTYKSSSPYSYHLYLSSNNLIIGADFRYSGQSICGVRPLEW